MKKIVTIILLNVILVVIQFVLISMVSTDGEMVWQANSARARLEAENQTLKQKIYSISSLAQINLLANDKNLTPMKTEFWREAVVAKIIP